jgi:hypothetical protein
MPQAPWLGVFVFGGQIWHNNCAKKFPCLFVQIQKTLHFQWFFGFCMSGMAEARRVFVETKTTNRKEKRETDTISTTRAGLANFWPAGELAG